MSGREHGNGEIRSISSADGFCVIHLRKYMMNREVGFGRRLFQILEEERLSFEHAPSGIDNISLILAGRRLPSERETRILDRIRTELGTDDVAIEHGLSLITVVGEHMRRVAGLAAKACTALADAGVNIEFIDQGSCGVSFMFGVREPDRQRAVQALRRALLPADANPCDATPPCPDGSAGEADR